MPSTVKIKLQRSHHLRFCAPLAVILTVSSVLQVSYCSNNVLKIYGPSNGGSQIGVGRPHEVVCEAVKNVSNSEIWWSRGDENVTSIENNGNVTLRFPNLTLSDIDNYTCNFKSSTGEVYTESLFLDFDVSPEIDTKISESIKRGMTVSVTCNATGYPLQDSIRWFFGTSNLNNSSNITISPEVSSLTYRYSSLKIVGVTDVNNGTYYCQFGNRREPVDLIVLSPPVIKFGEIKAVGESKIFLNWAVKDGNSPLNDLTLSFKEVGNPDVSKKDIANTTKFVLNALKPNTKYTNFEIVGSNALGAGGDNSTIVVTTLAKDPHFVPSVSIAASTSRSLTISWDFAQNMSEYYHFFKIQIRNEKGRSFSRIARETPYMVTDLYPGTSYFFQVQACSNYTELCDEPSKEMNFSTIDGKPSEPLNVNVTCHFNSMTYESVITATWDEPQDPQGQIIEYLVSLNGEAMYTDRNGSIVRDTIPESRKSISSEKHRKVEFPGQPPNTNFSVSVCAKSRSRQCGSPGIGTCTSPVAPPNVEELSKASWKSYISKKNRVYFLVTLPPISQRNGSICCFRVVVVRLPKKQEVNSLQKPHEMDRVLRTYEQVHNSSDSHGAYVAEMLNSSSLRSSQNLRIAIGDEENSIDDKRSLCHQCWPNEPVYPGMTGSDRRSPSFPNAKMHNKRHSGSIPVFPTPVRDGPLDSESNYTAYLDAIIINKAEVKTAQSRYFDALQPKLVQPAQHSSINAILDKNLGMLIVGSLIVAVIVIFMALMCVMRWRRKEPGDQEYGISHSIQQLCRRLRGQQLIPSEVPPDQPPISKEMLVAAYQERHENADAGFKKEFEQLPDRFADRAAEASEKNVGKNRYPDIKAYDQTRVKLSTAEGGSDYINANIVVGYKERKKFICAQGPMESTVVDWWRMIWEQRVHLLIMLTNVEEYSKTKCAKYWPSEGSNEYGSITVTHVGEKRFSDYLVRNLKLRLNGPDGDTVKEEREIEQFHYLVWKDYNAPEHPVGIIRFIKRCNEAYSLEMGPILVHCSAGVGRTGTLVALDSLLQQLNDEGCVTIFNTICDLRHQRNYLVQSQVQYIFIYRALMEASLFGDTEIAVSELKNHIEKLKTVAEGKTVCRIQEEFERLSQVIEDRRPFSAGSSEENRHRNRHENIIPYDRNRVILSPMPGPNKEICTYINASFIEGYDSSEQYIIAQDPLEVTVGDFWRMIVEHNVRSVVMLSEVGEDKCPRYWPEKDQETSHDYIRVKYMQSQSFPFYYRREFTVTNTKAEDSCLVTQFQYNGWPVGEMAVPDSARGIAELIDTTFKHKETLDKLYGPTLIHCSAGADRSCIFVALAILVRQMMNESRVDVFSVVRKLRSQRQGLFQNLAQYEFIYRGLDIYADLHVANGNASH